MKGYILQRLLLSIPVLLGVIILVFAIVRLIPGDPAQVIAGMDADPAVIERVTRELGLDQGLHIQFGIYLRNLLKGDLGKSIFYNRPVTTLIFERLPYSLELAFASLIVSTCVGITVGIISATRRYSLFDNISMVAALAGVAIPNFWFGLMLLVLFSVTLGWLPSAGRGTLMHLILPALTLGLSGAGLLARMTRSSMLDVLRQDYITTARAKGLREKVVIRKHALKNALIPVVTIMGLSIAFAVAGSVIVENVFAWPGVGRLMVGAIFQRDYIVVQGCALLVAVSVIFMNLVVDVLYAYLDPRIRYTKGEGSS
jgi:peptide/nickel transport system permease protein